MSTTLAVIYGRFSPRPDRKAAACESIEAQIQLCNKHCENEGWTVMGRYADENASGKDSDRQGLQLALDDVCKRKGVLVAYSLSRIARSTLDAITICNRLHAAGADLACVRDKIDTTTAMGRFMFRLMANLAELERDLISERTQDEMLAHQARGRRMSCLPPYGWLVDPDSPPHKISGLPSLMKADDAEQEVIAAIIYNKEQAGLSLRAIAALLNEGGTPCRSAKGWTHQQVKAILKRAGKL